MTDEGPLLRWTKRTEDDQLPIEWKRGDFLIDATEWSDVDGYLVSVLKKSEYEGYDLLHDNPDYQTRVSNKKHVRPAIERFAHRINVEKFDHRPDESYSTSGEQTKFSDHIES